VTHVPEFIARRWKSNDGDLLVGALPVSRIAEQYGTPLFVYDESVLEHKLASLREALPSTFHVCYSVKANPNPAFLALFLEHECGLEIASAGELQQALAAGCVPEDVLFAGPGKTEAELALAIKHSIGEIHVESELEIKRVAEISRLHRRRARIAIRVNPGEDGLGGAMRMGGKSAPFGIDEEKLIPALRRITDDPYLSLRGIHLFAGTQILDYRTVLAQYRQAIEIAKAAYRANGLALTTLDFGGGLGIPYFPGDDELDLDQLRPGVAEIMSSIKDDPTFAEVTFVVEPGRFLVGPAGVYVTRVCDVKVSRRKKYLILDGGMNHHLAASGNLGQVIKRNFPISVLKKFDSPAVETVDVVGPLCTPLDTLARSAQLPIVEVGDLVGVFQSGAYARAASPLGFLSHPSPPEVLVEDGQDALIRRRGSLEDLFQDLRGLNATLQSVT
jgi:diaminopimelate decarboxylase